MVKGWIIWSEESGAGDQVSPDLEKALPNA